MTNTRPNPNDYATQPETFTVPGTTARYSNVRRAGYTFKLRFLPGNFAGAKVAWVPETSTHDERQAVMQVLRRRAGVL